jgi:flagellar protein FlbC
LLDTFVVTLSPQQGERNTSHLTEKPTQSKVSQDISRFEDKLSKEISDKSEEKTGTENEYSEEISKQVEKNGEKVPPQENPQNKSKKSSEKEKNTSGKNEETAEKIEPKLLKKENSHQKKEKLFPVKSNDSKSDKGKDPGNALPGNFVQTARQKNDASDKLVSGEAQKTSEKSSKDKLSREKLEINNTNPETKNAEEVLKKGTGESVIINENTSETQKKGSAKSEKEAIKDISEVTLTEGEVKKTPPENIGRGKKGAEELADTGKTEEEAEGKSKKPPKLHVDDRRTGIDNQSGKPEKPSLKPAANENGTAEFSSSKMASSPKQTVENSANHFQRVFRNFQDNTQGDFIRSARLVLKNEGQGEIRLMLRPEELGSVRIKMELADNRITGRIIVDTPQARETLEQNLPGLYKALRDSGFESASLDVAVGGRDGKANQGDQEGDRSNPEYLPSYAEEFEKNTIFADLGLSDKILVNLMV